MNERHPDRETLERFLDDGLPEPASRDLQRHVLVCPQCEERLTALLPGPAPFDSPPPSYRGLIRRLLDDHRTEISDRRRTMAVERGEASELWRELESLGLEERRARVWSSPRYQSWGLFEHLIDLSQPTVLEEPRKAESLLRIALDVAEQLDPQEYGPGAVEGARTRAWSHLGNSLRVLGDFHQAELAFQTAELYFSRSWLDPVDEARLLELKAALRRAQRRFDEALELLDASIAVFREVNEPHHQGRVLMTKGLTLQYKGDVRAAIDCFRTSLLLLDPDREPRLVAMSQFNLVGCLQDSGRSAEAAALIPDVRRMAERVGKRSDLLRLRWTEGKVAASTGHPAEAEEALLEVREDFLADSLAFDAALVSLDLAALYFKEGRLDETKILAEEVIPVFRSREVYREALAALIVFQRAAEMEQLTLGLVEEIADYLKQARGNPHLPFRTNA
jgi:tetratricopeptide (TPR) repeat protein